MKTDRIVNPAQYIGSTARQALIAEVDTTPKPGLVDKLDNGAHTDMNRDTFIASADAIAPYLVLMAEAGFNWEGSQPELFSCIRPLGISAEKAMFEATKGVNTHKGLIFSLGILCAAAGQVFRMRQGFDSNLILDASKAMTESALEQEFLQIGRRKVHSHGEELYMRYGVRGIRGEAAGGFPSVKEISLPVMRQFEDVKEHAGADDNRVYLMVLLHLMAKVEDTNVLYRTDAETAKNVNLEAAKIIACGGSFSLEGMEKLRELNQNYIERRISPGGCADLLAVTIFLWLLEKNHLDGGGCWNG